MPPTWNDGMLEFWNNGQKHITSQCNHDIFQCDAVQIQYSAKASLRAKYSIFPSFQSHDLEALDRL
jgi:hypothetical protein